MEWFIYITLKYPSPKGERLSHFYHLHHRDGLAYEAFIVALQGLVA